MDRGRLLPALLALVCLAGLACGPQDPTPPFPAEQGEAAQGLVWDPTQVRTQLSPSRIALSADEIDNPGRGLYEWSGNRYITPSHLISDQDAYRRFTWRDLEPSAGTYDFTKIDSLISGAATSGKRVIIGLPQPMKGSSNGGAHIPTDLTAPTGTSNSYGTWWNGSYWPNFNNDTLLRRWEALIAELGRRYNGNPRVNMVQMMHYGAYGEYYIAWDAPTSVPVITRANARRTIQAFLAAFPGKRLSVMISNSKGGYMMREALLASPRIGWSRCALGFDGQMNNIDSLYTDPEVGELVKNRWKTAPVWTEMMGDFSDPDWVKSTQFAQAEAQVPRYHVSYVSNGNFIEPYNIKPYDSSGNRNTSSTWTQQNIDDFVMAGKLAGYRLAVARLELQRLVPGATVAVRWSWANDGSAPVYEPWKVKLQLRRADDTVAFESTSSIDLQQVLPTGTSTFEHVDSLALPSTLVPGTYRVHVYVPPLDTYVQALRLATTGRQADGSYRLGEVAVEVASEPPPGGIQRRAFSSANADAASSLALAVPAGVQAGDVMVAMVSNRQPGTALSLPSGWTEVRRETGGSILQVLLVRVASSSEPASYTASISGAVTDWGGGIVAYSGVDTARPVEAHAGQTGTGPSLLAPSVTTTSSSARLVYFATQAWGWSTLTADAPLTGLFLARKSSTDDTALAADEALTQPGPTGVRSCTSNQAGGYTAQVVALRPAPVTRTLAPQADTYGRDGIYADTSYGADTQLELRNSDALDFTRHVFLRFDLGSVLASRVTSATLRLYANELAAPTGVPLTVAGVASDAWDESTLTWNNQPATGAAAATVSPTNIGWVEWDVTTLVNSELAGDRRLSLRLSENAGLNIKVVFNSSENTGNTPALVVTYH